MYSSTLWARRSPSSAFGTGNAAVCVLFPAASVAAPSAVGATIPGEKQFRARRRSGAFTRACEREELLPEACEIRVAGGSPLARETCPENPTWRRANFSALSGSALELVSGKGHSRTYRHGWSSLLRFVVAVAQPAPVRAAASA
jgi:hypothetical protein